MKKTLLAFCAGILALPAFAQITLTSADMPVLGDTLRYTSMDVTAAGSLDLNTTGVNTSWDFSSSLSGISQGIDRYKSVVQVNPLYLAYIPAGAYGFQMDGIPGMSGLPVSIDSVYTFFKINSSPSRFDAVGFAALLSGALPIAATYSANDRWFLFPMNYENMDTNAYRLTATIPTIGDLTQVGTRYNHVDGWGTIKTPYYTTAVDCIRLRSEIVEVDTIMISGSPMNLDRHTIEYKWMVNGDHYPALWVVTDVSSGTPEVISARYRDQYRPGLGLENTNKTMVALHAYPNPAANGIVTLDIPASWSRNYLVDIFDVTGKRVMTVHNSNVLNIQELPAGQYVVRVLSGEQKGYVQITR